MIKKVFIFALGAAAGSLVTWKLVEEKYKKIADEEIESVIEHFKSREEECEKCEATDIQGVNDEVPWSSDEEKEKYEEQVKDLEYTAGLVNIVDDTEGIFETEADIKEYIQPYVISPEEFGEFGNTTRCLTYYSDFVLVDEDDDIVVDPETLVGEALEHFGEYEDDCVHVRNENLEMDFEILRSEKSFTEINKGDN